MLYQNKNQVIRNKHQRTGKKNIQIVVHVDSDVVNTLKVTPKNNQETIEEIHENKNFENDAI